MAVTSTEITSLSKWITENRRNQTDHALRKTDQLFVPRPYQWHLPLFVNLGVLGLNYGLQASQFTATSTTAECQTLSNPMYVHSIPNNNDNQDIVSMGTNSALLAKQSLRILIR